MDSGTRTQRTEALFLAHLRFQVVAAGGVCGVLRNRAIYVNEYSYNTTPLTSANLGELAAAKEMTEYVADYWLQYVALLRHIFITRGHHYKAEYNETITNTWNATTIAAPDNVNVPQWDTIFRAGLHCFGVRVLELLVQHAHGNGTLAKSFVTRLNASPAGVAATTTGWAVVEAMMKATWWSDFNDKYKVQVDQLRTEARYAKSIGLQGHVNAKLFNWDWTAITLTHEAVTALAPLLLGFLDTLDVSESIKRQRAVNKRGEGGAIVRATFARVILNEQQNAQFMQTVKAFLEGVMASV